MLEDKFDHVSVNLNICLYRYIYIFQELTAGTAGTPTIDGLGWCFPFSKGRVFSGNPAFHWVVELFPGARGEVMSQ